MDTQLFTFKTDTATLHYQKIGHGATLLFLPGSISDYRTWGPVVAHFADRYECYVLSRRFQFPEKYQKGGDGGIAANTEDIAAFIRAEKLGKVVLIGHSFGGYIAINLAVKYPGLVQAVVAEEPIFTPALLSNPKNPLQLLGLLFRNFKAGKSFARMGMKGIEPAFKALAANDPEKAKKAFIDGITAGKKTPETLDELTQIQLNDNIAGLAGENPFEYQFSLKSTKAIQCPVLLLSGTESPYFFRYINDCLAANIPNNRNEVIENAGHWIHIDQPVSFVETVRKYLLQVEKVVLAER